MVVSDVLVYGSFCSTPQQSNSFVVEPHRNPPWNHAQATRQVSLLIKVKGDVVTELKDSIQCCNDYAILCDVTIYINIV